MPQATLYRIRPAVTEPGRASAARGASRMSTMLPDSSTSATAGCALTKSEKLLCPSAFSLNDGSSRLMRLLTAEACCQSASSLSLSSRSARSSRSADGSAAGLRARVRGAAASFFCSTVGRATPGSASYASNWSHAAASDFAVEPATPTPDDEPAEPLAALRERDVVGVARDDHDVGEVGEAEHVLDGVDREADVGAVLRVGRGGEQLHEVDRARDELRPVDRVDRRRPVGVRAGEHERAEGCRVVDDRADVDRRGGQALGDLGLARVLGDPLAVARVGVAAVHAVVPGHDDVVEVEVDRDALVLEIGHVSPPRGSARR